MKKNYSFFILAILSVFSFSKTHAQAMMDLHLLSPVTQNVYSQRTTVGWGLGAGLYTPEIKLIKSGRIIKYNYGGLPKQPPLALRFGGTLMFASMGNKHLDDIPLLSPQTGTATVTFGNMLYGMNLSAKLYASIADGKILAYAEGFAGYRGFESSMTIEPNDKSRYTDSTISTVKGFNYGGSAGLLFKINAVYIDAGVILTHSDVQGNSIDLFTLKKVGGSADFHFQPSPYDYMIFKIGITGLLYGDGRNTGGSRSRGYWGGHSSCGHSGGGHSHISIGGHH